MTVFTANNITNIILQVSIIAITAYGMTYVLLLGDIDLSVGSTIALIGTFAALGASWGIPFILLVPLSIIAALALGMINGGLTAIAGDPVVYCHRCYNGDLPWYRLYSDRWYAHHD